MTSTIILQPHQIIKLEERFTHQEIGGIFGVNKKTIQRWKYSNSKPKQKRGVEEKIVGIVKDKLLSFTAYRSQDNTLTQQEMANRIQEEEKIVISQQTISRKFSAIDECHFYLNEAPRYGYAPIGQKVISPAPGSKGGSYSLIIWIKNEKGKGVKSLGEEGDYLVMDNASFHRAPDKRKELGLPSIEEQLSLKNSQLFSLPSRSPQLNPVELLFNNIRHNIEKARA
ncbi:17040_t:CDS:2 [Racocetra persica]|uniref:17040_t:CDS:1 n=1 Tax=Racocetra persica TaxID=160502 RepID=A0ACA9LSY8_9GLOM|nr:17040_t:CDS:2 [Racocetra persica]